MKKNNRNIYKVLVLQLLLIFCLSSYANGVVSIGEANKYRDIKVIINDKETIYSIPSAVANESKLIPMRLVFEALGAQVSWDSVTRSVKGINGDVDAIVKLDTYFYQIDNEVVQLSGMSKVIEGSTMIPVDLVEYVFNVKVNWESDKGIITITNSEKLDTNNQDIGDTLTISAAIEMAKKNSYPLKNAKEGVAKALKLKEQAANNLAYVPIGQGSSAGDAEIRGAFLTTVQANITWEMAKKSVEMLEEGIDFQVRALFDDITKKTDNLSLQSLVVKNAETQLNIISLKAEKGLESQLNLTKAKNTLAEEQQEKITVEKELENSYLKLNQYIGIKGNQAYNLNKELKPNWLTNFNLENHIQSTLQLDPNIWLKEQEIKSAEMKLTLYTYNALDAPYSVKEIDLKVAQNEKENLKKVTEELIRNYYFQMNQLENQYKILEVTLQNTETGVNALRKRYDLGMAIEADLLSAQVGLETIKNQMNVILISYEQMRQLLNKPWLQSGASN